MAHQALAISTVLTPATSYNLITLGELKTLLNVADTSSDAYFKLVIPQVSQAIATHCNRPFVVETIQDRMWNFRDGFPGLVRARAPVIQLSRWPVVTITSVTAMIAGVLTTLAQGTDFVLDAACGQITRLDAAGFPRPWWDYPLTVVYTAGFAAVPPDVVDVAARLIKAAWYAQSRDPMIRSQNSPGVYEASFWFGSGPGSVSGLPPDIEDRLDRYRVPVVG